MTKRESARARHQRAMEEDAREARRASRKAPSTPEATEAAGKAPAATTGADLAQREEVLKVVVLLVQTLSTSLGLSKEEACRMLRWAAHVIEGSKEEL